MKRILLVGSVSLIIGIILGCGVTAFYPQIDFLSRYFPQYKKTVAQAEIPISWSTVFQGDVGQMSYKDFYRYQDGTLTPYASSNSSYAYGIAQDEVAYGDINWTQIDVAWGVPADIKRVVKELKSNQDPTLGTWTTEMVDGKQADVLTFTLENGQVSKGSTGGKVYFITWQELVPDWDGNYEDQKLQDYAIVIWKQALGDEDFEQGFTHFIQTLKLQSLF